jgi:hypothetical protein
MNTQETFKNAEIKPDGYTLLGTGFSGNVIVEYAPISERMWTKGDEATIRDGQIRLGGCWFNFDDRYVVKACA